MCCTYEEVIFLNRFNLTVLLWKTVQVRRMLHIIIEAEKVNDAQLKQMDYFNLYC